MGAPQRQTVLTMLILGLVVLAFREIDRDDAQELRDEPEWAQELREFRQAGLTDDDV